MMVMTSKIPKRCYQMYNSLKLFYLHAPVFLIQCLYLIQSTYVVQLPHSSPIISQPIIALRYRLGGSIIHPITQPPPCDSYQVVKFRGQYLSRGRCCGLQVRSPLPPRAQSQLVYVLGRHPAYDRQCSSPIKRRMGKWKRGERIY